MQRRIGVTLAVSAAVAALASCAVPSRLYRHEIVVKFGPSASQAQHDAVRSACAGLPHIVTEPARTSALASVRANNVRFDVTAASDAEQAALTMCVSGLPGVVGFDAPTNGEG